MVRKRSAVVVTKAGHYKIEAGMQVPDRRSDSSPLQETLRALKVGDSFLVPVDTKRNQLSAKIGMASLRNNARYVTRKMPDSIRIWRVE